MKKLILMLIVVFVFAEFTDAQMMNPVRYQSLKVNSGFSVDDDIDYMKKRRKKRKKSSRGRGSDEQNVIKLNPLGFFWGNILFYERALNDNFTVQLGLGYYSNKTESLSFFGGVEYKYSGINISPSARYYFMGEAPKGFYASAGLNYLNRTEKVTYDDGLGTTTEYKNKISGFGGGLSLGYQWIWSGFSLDLSGGAVYTSYSYKYDPDYESAGLVGGLSFSGILPAFLLAVGYAF